MFETLTISQSMFQGFQKRWSEGAGPLRYGQAFYTYFKGHQVVGRDKDLMDMIFCADYAEAQELIHRLIDRNQ